MNKPWMKHCGFCGGKNNYNNKEGYFSCNSCGRLSWPQNKTAVCVSVPVWDGEIFKGFIYTERAIDPVGALCLVSGFQDFGEHHFHTAAREFQEEVFGESECFDFFLDKRKMKLNDVRLAKGGTINIICIEYTGVEFSKIYKTIKNFTPNEEVSKVFIASEPIKMEWEIHTNFMQEHFNKLKENKLIM